MKIFLSWSGAPSKCVADGLRVFLPQVIQAIDPWMSTEIPKGLAWQKHISDGLENANAGIVCLTKDNLRSPWLHFEAGVLVKNLNEPFKNVCPYLLDLSPSDVSAPLSLLQLAKADETETYDLVEDLNERLQKPLDPERLRKAFKNAWPELAASLDKAKGLVSSDGANASPHRDDREILEEILSLARAARSEEIAAQNSVTVPRKIFEALLDAVETGPSAQAVTLRSKRDLQRDAALAALRMNQVDELTGLMNRKSFAQKLSLAPTGAPMSLAILDIDHFKKLNDTFGHSAGDTVLKDLGKILSAMADSHDLDCARWGGEEFALSGSVDARTLLEICSGLAKAVASYPFAGPSGRITVTLSGGVTELRGPDDVESALSRADEALYKAKADGRDRILLAAQ